MPKKAYKPTVLVIMDGVGAAPPGAGNAVTNANTPNLDEYWPKYPHGYLKAAETAVGLPPGADGNSEVGHTVLGAGKVMQQDVTRINNAIRDESFFQNPEIKKAFEHARTHNSNLHLLGLVGDGTTHSDIDHLYALLKFAKDEDLNGEKVFIHAITDGRDSPRNMAKQYLAELREQCKMKNIGKLASVVGRYYAMDRDKRWDRTKLAYDLYTQGEGHQIVDLEKAIDESYSKDIYDEHLEPMVILDDATEKFTAVADNDVVIFFNFRPDRAVQITRAFEQQDFDGFEREPLQNLYFLGMARYDDEFPTHVAFQPDKAENPLGKILAANEKRQLRVAESEKYAHVTYFFNNGIREAHAGEDWIEVPSPRDVHTYDEKPEMSQHWVADIVTDKLSKAEYDFILVNLAAPDMVGHTGNLDAAIKAVESADECVGKIVNKVLELGGVAIITADHGNAESMIDPLTGEPDTNHSVNHVPIIYIANEFKPVEVAIGTLADVAPTVLGLMQLQPPADMTGRDLLADYDEYTGQTA